MTTSTQKHLGYAQMRPLDGKFQVMLLGPHGTLLPGDVFPTKEALLRQYPTAVFEHPRPVLPPDLKGQAPS